MELETVQKIKKKNREISSIYFLNLFSLAFLDLSAPPFPTTSVDPSTQHSLLSTGDSPTLFSRSLTPISTSNCSLSSPSARLRLTICAAYYLGPFFIVSTLTNCMRFFPPF